LNRFQRVVLNGNESNWTRLNAGVPQGSVLGPLLFLIYINDLTDNISSDMRLFADDSSLFTCVKGVTQTHHKLVKDLQTVSLWAYQWKMVFNPDITKQAIEVIFSCKNNKPVHPDLIFNDVPVSREPHTKHLGVYLDSRLNFGKHIKEQVSKAMKGVSLLKFLCKYVDRNVLDLSYKMYVRPHLDYGDVIFHNQRMDLMELIERVQYKAALIVSGCWQGTSREKLYDELGWESLNDRRWARRMTIFYKINNGLAPSYLSQHVPQRNEITCNLRNRVDSTPFIRTDRYENSFYPYTIKAWKNLDNEAKSKPSVLSFKKHLNDFIRPLGHPLFGIRDKYGTKLLTKIRVTFSDLRDHRFNHNFNCENPLCSCGIEDETSVHFFLRCPLYLAQRSTLLGKISAIISSDVTVFPDEHLHNILVYGSNVYNSISNKLILTETITFIRNSGRFTNLEAFS
jgi:ribonuclease P/MRP protein subunit RPP40